jgi:hypothetical protein
MAERDWDRDRYQHRESEYRDRDRDRDRDRYDQPYGNQEFREQQWGPRRHYGGTREWDAERYEHGGRTVRERIDDWSERNTTGRDERPLYSRDYRPEQRDKDRDWDRSRERPDWESQRWMSSRDRSRMLSTFESDQGEKRYDREFENRGAAQRDWTDRRVGTDRGYRNTDYGGSWGQQTTGGMRGDIFGGMLHESGRYAGRGPKNWQRSEERIREDINEALTRHPAVDASEVDVQVTAGEVTLTGTVSSRHEKRAAEDCAWDVSGVRDVHNHLKVNQGVLERITSAFSGEERK